MAKGSLHSNVRNDAAEHVRKAIAALQLAQPELQNATIDFCGHRTDAINVANTAVSQLQGAVACMSGKALSYETHKEGNLPNVRAALKELKKARKDLQKADNTFCGNRESALGAVDSVIAQLQLVMV